MLNYVTIRKFCELSGYSENAIRTKIRDGVWFEDKVWIKAPDGRVLISVDGYHQWVNGAKVHAKRLAKSPLPIVSIALAGSSGSSPDPLTF
jgi:hypothetical protein